MDAPYTCKFCGAPSYIDESDQIPPPDYCHPEDHGNREDWLYEQAEGERYDREMHHGQGR